jgi:hypothetical protein
MRVVINRVYSLMEIYSRELNTRRKAMCIHIHTHIHTYIHTHIHTYIHTYIHAYADFLHNFPNSVLLSDAVFLVDTR